PLLTPTPVSAAPSSLFPPTTRPPPSTLFSYTTLFRSPEHLDDDRDGLHHEQATDDHQHELMLCRHRHRTERTADRQRSGVAHEQDRKSTRLNSSHRTSSYAVFCLKKKRKRQRHGRETT